MRFHRIWRNHIPQINHHHLFVCRHERIYCHTIISHTNRRRMIMLVDVPGNRHVALLHKELTEYGRETIKAIKSWMLDVHSLGLSFSGRFRAKDLYVTESKAIKIRSSKKRRLKPLAPERRAKDRHRIAEIIESILFPGTNGEPAALPYDVLHLLDVLRHGGDADDFLLYRHPAGMTSTEKLGLFTELYTHLQCLEQTDPDKYLSIVQSLPYDDGQWTSLAGLHEYLTNVLNYRNRANNYEDNPSGMLLLKRHSLAHLVEDQSVMILTTKKIEVDGSESAHTEITIKFQYKDIAHMFSFTFPQVIAKLQFSLHQEKELERIYDPREE